MDGGTTGTSAAMASALQPPASVSNGSSLEARPEAAARPRSVAAKAGERSDQIATLATEIQALGVQIARAQAQLARKLTELNELGGCAGYRSTAHWASWNLGLTPAEGHRLARVASRVGDLPTLAERFDAGGITLSAMDAVGEIATVDNEAAIAEVCDAATGSQIVRVCREYRAAAADHADTPPEPFFSLRADRGGYRVSGWMDALDGAVFKAGLAAATDDLFATPRERDGEPTAADTPAPTNGHTDGGSGSTWAPTDPDLCAADTPTPTGPDDTSRGSGNTPTPTDDAHGTARNRHVSDPPVIAAIRALAERYLDTVEAGPERRDRYLTIVHVTLDGLVELDDGTELTRERFVELVGTSPVAFLVSLGGVPLWQTRTTRQPSRALRRALRARDRACRYPGCGTTGYLEAHHLVPYAERPETAVAGLVLLCSHHHRWAHRRGEQLVCGPDGAIIVQRSDGSTWNGHRAPVDPPPLPDPPEHASYPPSGPPDRLTNFGLDVYLHALLGARAAPDAENGRQ